MPPAVPGELFGPKVEKNLIYINLPKNLKNRPMCDIIFIVFLGLEIT